MIIPKSIAPDLQIGIDTKYSMNEIAQQAQRNYRGYQTRTPVF
jgi:hypothetical protein